jgi:hypothetical protein
MRGTLVERFEAKYIPEPNSGCWLWEGSYVTGGYGQIRIGSTRVLAHHVAYQLFKGEVGESKVLHNCDNPACVNPGHLRLGTQSENIKESVDKGRKNIARGERCGSSKLTESQVCEIKYLLANTTLRQRDIAAKYGVHQVTISKIDRGRCWGICNAPTPQEVLSPMSASRAGPAVKMTTSTNIGQKPL